MERVDRISADRVYDFGQYEDGRIQPVDGVGKL